jgi:hypothetical protein
LWGAAAIPLILGLMVPTSASAIDDINTRKLREAVTVNGILQHERAFQRIADENGGTRASGTPGYDASARYVARTLRRAGYKATLQEFTFAFYCELARGVVAQVSPNAVDYETTTLEYSGSGDVTGQIVPTNDIVIPPTPAPSSMSGCEASDFPAAPNGPAIALIRRGTCTLELSIEVGILTGGLFSGAEGIKTAEQAATYGGQAGVAYDPCYHEACDTITNVNTKALFELGDAAAHATLTMALSREGLFEDGSRVGQRSAKAGVKAEAHAHANTH